MGSDQQTSAKKHQDTAASGVEVRTGKLGRTSIRLRFMFMGAECRETLRIEATAGNIRYAIRLRAEILNAIERRTFKYHEFFPNSVRARQFGPIPSRKTIGDLLEAYLKRAESTLSPSTVRGYREVCKAHLFPQFKNTLLLELAAGDLRGWLAEMRLTTKRVRNILTPLRNVLDEAVSDELIAFNPLDRIKLDKVLARESRNSEYDPDPFSIDEILAILKACDGQERNFWQCAFASGLRTSEMIALEWPHLDFVHFRIGVRKAQVEGVIKETKTAAGERDINMLQAAFEALNAQKRYTFLAGMRVFLDPRYNLPWVGDRPLYFRWGRILRKAGVRYRNPYQTRHTFASTLLACGVPSLYVAKQMGHRDTEMVNRHYGRWIEQGCDPDARARIVAFFAHVSPKIAFLGLKAA